SSCGFRRAAAERWNRQSDEALHVIWFRKHSVKPQFCVNWRGFFRGTGTWSSDRTYRTLSGFGSSTTAPRVARAAQAGASMQTPVGIRVEAGEPVGRGSIEGGAHAVRGF